MFAESGETLRFRDVELNVAGYELRRRGRRVRLERQPMDLLILLVERRGQLVSRNDIAERLWGKDVFIDVETGIHRAILKIRQALHDSPDAPAFIETVSGKGYRFIAPIEVVSPPSVEHPASDVTPTGQPLAPVGLTQLEAAPQPRHRGRTPLAMTAAAGLIGLVIVAALTWAGFGGSSRTPHVRLAVLPFENHSGDPGREHLADGLTAEMSNALGGVLDPKHVSVIARTSMMAYKGTRRSLADIGRAEGVDYLLESSMRTEGDRVYVTSNLVRVSDQVQVDTVSYDSELTSITGAQRELSSAIAQQVRLRLSAQHLSELERRHSSNREANNLYLRGLAFSKQRTPTANQDAINAYQAAIELDRDYALAWAGIALTYSASTINSGAAPRDVAGRAKDAADRAVKAGRELAEAHLALGHVSWLGWDWPRAEAEFRRAVELDSSSAQGYYLLGHALSQRGRRDEARKLLEKARALDRGDPMMHAMSAQVAFQARDFAAALKHAREATNLAKDFWIGHIQMAQAYEASGKATLALEALRKAPPSDTGSLALRGYILAKKGDEGGARDVLNELAAVAKRRNDGYVPPSHMALVHAGLGDKEAAFAWLDKAFAAHDVRLMFLPVDPKWDRYRKDPKFKKLLADCGFTDDE